MKTGSTTPDYSSSLQIYYCHDLVLIVKHMHTPSIRASQLRNKIQYKKNHSHAADIKNISIR